MVKVHQKHDMEGSCCCILHDFSVKNLKKKETLSFKVFMCVSTTWKEWNGPLLQAEKLSSTNSNSSWPCLYCIKNIWNRLDIHFHWIFIMTNSDCNNNKMSTGYRCCGDINSKFIDRTQFKNMAEKKTTHTDSETHQPDLLV